MHTHLCKEKQDYVIHLLHSDLLAIFFVVYLESTLKLCIYCFSAFAPSGLVPLSEYDSLIIKHCDEV